VNVISTYVKMESVENDKKKQRKTLLHLHTNIPIVKGNIFIIYSMTITIF